MKVTTIGHKSHSNNSRQQTSLLSNGWKITRSSDRSGKSGNHRDPRYQKLLNSKRWKEVRMRKLQKNPLCERCLEQGYYVSAIDVHHIIPVESARTVEEMEQLAYNENNLKALCISCHVAIHKEMGKNTKEQVKQRQDIYLQRWIDRHNKKNGDPSPEPTETTK